MTVLVFSEEYVKITKGMFLVWMNYVGEASKKHNIDIILNHEHWAFTEAKDAFRTNHQVTVHRLLLNMPSTLVKRIFAAGDGIFLFRAIRYATGQTLNLVLSPIIILYLYLLLRQVKPHAVVSHNGGWPAGQLCRWIIIAAMLAGIPRRIIFIHSYPTKPHRFLLPLRFLQAWIIDKCASAIVTVSDSVKNVLETEVFTRPVYRIYNGIKIAQPMNPAEPTHSTLNWHPSGLAVGFLGAIYPHKGPHVLLDAFRLVHLPCELAMMGPADKAYLDSLKQRAGHCTNKVTFLGFHQDIDSFIQNIDILVVPSVAFESFGMVILEAMKHSKPVICSNFGGMKEVVEDGVTGLVVPAGDELALAEAITTLLAAPDKRRQMGAAGYRRLNELFTSEKMASQYEQFL